MLNPELEVKLRNAKDALDGATAENIIALCKQYLALLAAYRSELYTLPSTPGINLRSGSSSPREEIENTRKAVRVAIEHNTQERHRTEALLRSFTAVSGYEAEGILNQRKYKGHDDWKLSAGGVRSCDNTDDDSMTIQEAVDTASLLRREEYIAQVTASEGQR